MRSCLRVSVLVAAFTLVLSVPTQADVEWEKRIASELTRLEGECAKLDQQAAAKGGLVDRAKALDERIAALEVERGLEAKHISLAEDNRLGSLTLALVKMNQRIKGLSEVAEDASEDEPASSPSAPEPAGSGLEPAERKRRLKRLRTRAQTYLKERKAVVARCRTCNGTGHHVRIRSGTGGRETRTEKCESCHGFGRRIAVRSYVQVHYHLKSPAYRARVRGVDWLRSEAVSLQRTGPPARITRTVLKEVTLHGDDYGVALVKVNREKEYTPIAWIWVGGLGGISGEWFLYDETADGEWPDLSGSSADAGPDAPSEAVKSTALEPDDQECLEAALGSLTLAHQLASASKTNRELFLVLSSAGIPAQELHGRAADDAVRTARAIWGNNLEWQSIRWTFVATWRNDFGETEERPYITADLEKKVFDRIVWANLTSIEAFRLFLPDHKRYDGYELWQ